MIGLLTLMLAGATPAVAANPAGAALTDPSCPRTSSLHAFDRSKPLKPQKLGDLPPANAYKAAYRLVRGCEVPLVVKYGVGGR